jgi:hypothetical protein
MQRNLVWVYPMDNIAWDDFDEAQQRVIAVLAAGVSIGLCDPVALLTLKRFGFVRGAQLTAKAEELRKAALLQQMVA